MRYAIMQSGLSLPVIWAFCTGMNYSDPVKNAREHIRRVMELPLDALQTQEDMEAVKDTLRKWLPLLPPSEQTLTPLMEFLYTYGEESSVPSAVALAAE